MEQIHSINKKYYLEIQGLLIGGKKDSKDPKEYIDKIALDKKDIIS